MTDQDEFWLEPSQYSGEFLNSVIGSASQGSHFVVFPKTLSQNSQGSHSLNNFRRPATFCYVKLKKSWRGVDCHTPLFFSLNVFKALITAFPSSPYNQCHSYRGVLQALYPTKILLKLQAPLHWSDAGVSHYLPACQAWTVEGSWAFEFHHSHLLAWGVEWYSTCRFASPWWGWGKPAAQLAFPTATQEW